VKHECLPLQVLDVYIVIGGELVFGRHDYVSAPVFDDSAHDVLDFADLGRKRERKVYRTVDDFVVESAEAVALDEYFNVFGVLRIVADDFRRSTVQVDRLYTADIQSFILFVFQAFYFFRDRVYFRHEFFEFVIQQLACGRKLEVPGVSFEQRQTELVLQEGDLLAERRLRDVQHIGCFREVQVFCCCEEVFYSCEVQCAHILFLTWAAPTTRIHIYVYKYIYHTHIVPHFRRKYNYRLRKYNHWRRFVLKERAFIAPGRVEIGGNHTDHQRGRVIAAAVDLNIRCTAAANGTDIIRICSAGFDDAGVDLADLNPHESEKGSPAALVRGIGAWFRDNGHDVGGFDCKVSSDLPAGIGLSSSAAFEVLIGNVFRELFDADVSDLGIALAGQYAENVYFGKPSGLMDQAVSAFGGLMMIDFQNPAMPAIDRIDAGFDDYAICIVNVGSSHDDLTDDYAAIPMEMRAVAAAFGEKDLRSVNQDEFFASIGRLRGIGDRAVLRAIHFFTENERVVQQAVALGNGDVATFLRLVAESGRSSLALLQNVYCNDRPQDQGLTLALALCERLLQGNGAFRVHGGGFAGSVLAFVPIARMESFEAGMSDVFGSGCCRFVSVCAEGGREQQRRDERMVDYGQK